MYAQWTTAPPRPGPGCGGNTSKGLLRNDAGLTSFVPGGLRPDRPGVCRGPPGRPGRPPRSKSDGTERGQR